MVKRIFSGMQPSGNPHLGNYLGAMRQHIEAQATGAECIYFIANYHALTSLRDAAQLRQNTLELAMDYLALGLDPKKVIFYRQSDLPEVTELAWILSTVTGHGLLERGHAWKDALQKGKKGETVGLFTYPILMAADILIMQPDEVPVGKDQKQHVEMARDIAASFNSVYGETFKLPEPIIKEDVAVVPGTDGQKMSKSYGNVIEIFAPGDVLKKQVMSVTTDSKSVEEPKDPEHCLPFQIMEHFMSETDRMELMKKLMVGGMGYGDLKKMLLERLLEYFSKAREERLRLENNLDYVEEVLHEGAQRARALGGETMDEVRKKTGLN